MNLKPEIFDGVSIYRNIDLDETDSMVRLKNFWDREFEFGQEIFFHLYRKESLTDDNELRTIESNLLDVFNQDNLYVIRYLDDIRFSILFRHEYQFGSASLILKLWKYCYSLAFFSPRLGVEFDDVIKYYDNHQDRDVYLRTFMSKGFTDCTYIKGLGGDTLIKNALEAGES